MPAKINIPIGTRFGKLVFQAVSPRKTKSGDSGRYWILTCGCGNRIETLGADVRRGVTQSCGCIRKAMCGALRRTHGMTGTPEYGSWLSLIQRCENPSDQDYHHYGGRGITIAPEWRHSFETFYRDMGPKPTTKHSIERVNNNLGYMPGNCIWATPIIQQRNCRRNRMLTHNGKTQCISAWAEELGMPYTMLQQRLWRGWSDERALTTPRLQ